MFFSKRTLQWLWWLTATSGAAFAGIIVYPFFQKVLEDAQAYGKPHGRMGYLGDVVADILRNPHVAWIGGLAAGVFLALSAFRWLVSHEKIHRRALRISVQTPQEVQQAFKAASVCITPRTSMSSAQAELDSSSSPLSESYYSLRTSILKAGGGGLPRGILVTSSDADEGKSTTALALARQFSEIGYSVCLVDADLRRPSIVVTVPEGQPYGLSAIASGNLTLEEAVDRWSGGLDVIPAGGGQPNSANILARLARTGFWTVVADRYDLVVVDAPPVLGIADAPILGMDLEHIVFVVEANRTLLETAENAHRRIRESTENTTFVLSKAGKRNLRGTSFIGGYGYGYGYTAYGDQRSIEDSRLAPPEPRVYVPIIPLSELTWRRIGKEAFSISKEWRWLLLAIMSLAVMLGYVVRMISNSWGYGIIFALGLAFISIGGLAMRVCFELWTRSKRAGELLAASAPPADP